MGLTLDLHALVAVLIGLHLSRVHCSRTVLLPLEPPSLSLTLAGISINLNRPAWQLIFSPHRQSYAFMGAFMKHHLTPDVHAAHVGAKVLPPGRHRSLLRPAGGLHGVLLHPLYWSSLLIVRHILGPFLWIINTRAARRVTVARL